MNFLNKDEWTLDSSHGIWKAKSSKTDTAFDDAAQDGLLALEDDSWWFSYRADVIIGQMNKYFSIDKLTIDIGGGNGFTSHMAQLKGFRTGVIEPSPKACYNAKMRGLDVVCCGAVTDTSVKDGSVEQMLLLDVLEHIEDDKAFLKLLNRKLADNGKIIITVPAFRCLWSSEDDVAGHFRRYRIDKLCRLLKKCGFSVLYRSYFMGFLFLPILFIRVFLEKIGVLKRQEDRSDSEREKIAKSQFKSRRGIVSVVLGGFEALESRLMRKSGRVPFGSSIIITAKKLHR